MDQVIRKPATRRWVLVGMGAAALLGSIVVVAGSLFARPPGLAETSAVMSAMHLLALALGLPAVVLRGRALRGPLDKEGLSRLFAADTVWGLAALLWIGTGLLRAFAGLEMGSQFYLSSQLFWVKMTLLAAILALEIWPMATFIAWRIRRGRGQVLDTAVAGRLYVVNQVQVALVIAMVFAASFMARGVSFGG